MFQIKREIVNFLWKIFPYRTSIRIDGTRFKIPIVRNLDRRVLTTDHEPWMSAILEQAFRVKQGTFIDIGTNSGQILLRYKALRPNGQYLGFEPNANCASYVQELIELNKWKDCTVLPVGIGDKNNVVKLGLNNISDLCASLKSGDQLNSSMSMSRSVLVLSASEAISLAGINDPAVIKVDVEGNETEVIKGLIPVMRSKRPIIICEVLAAQGKPELEKRNHKITSMLKSCDYQICEAWGNDISFAEKGLHDSRDIYLFSDQESTERLLS